MPNIAWKTINGYGPYAYLQHSVKVGQGHVNSMHIAYLGKVGVIATPGQTVTIRANMVTGTADVVAKAQIGAKVLVPGIGKKLIAGLKPGPATKIKPEWIDQIEGPNPAPAPEPIKAKAPPKPMNSREREKANKTKWAIDKMASAARRGDMDGVKHVYEWARKNKTDRDSIEAAYAEAMREAKDWVREDIDYS